MAEEEEEEEEGENKLVRPLAVKKGGLCLYILKKFYMPTFIS